MTSQENVALVQRFEDAWTRSDLDGALSCVADDFEFDWPNSMGPFVGTYRGHEGLKQFWSELLDAWEHFTPVTQEHIDCGHDRLVTLDVVRARGKGSGIDMEARGAMLWTFRDGKIQCVKMFQSKNDARAGGQLLEQGRP
jgi:ketosteroid isomerase-like protein